MNKPDKRQVIMQAAERLFTSRRFHEITLDEVAQAAQVGKGTIYLYFKDKDDLFFQVASSGFDELCDLLQRGVPDAGSFQEQLLGVTKQIAAFFQGRRQLFRMMQTEDGRMPWMQANLRQRWTEHRRRLHSAVAAVIRKGVEEGEVRSDIPPEVLAPFLLGMLRTRARDLDEMPEGMPRHEVVVDLFCRGAGCGSKGASE